MTHRILAAIGLISILAILGGAAYKAIAPRTGPSGSGVAVTLSDLPLTSHFHLFLGTVGAINNFNPSAPPFSVTLPANAGIAVTRLESGGGNNLNESVATMVWINGVLVWKGSVLPTGLQRASSPGVFDPPLIVKPGETLEIGLSPNYNATSDLSVGGHAFSAAQIGM